jgi:predicted N-acetyltransferase YhbS
MNDSNRLHCHPATPAERIQAFKNVFDVWRHADTLEDHLTKRLASPQHNRADWFVGCLGERVVVSLGCYPMQFSLQGDLVKGIAIGAVHTVSDCRGRSYAAELLSWVEEYQAGLGAEISLLFSDIDPRYYARLGYTLCPSMEGWVDFHAEPAMPPTGLSLIRFSPEPDRVKLMKIYTDHQRGLPFFIWRDEDYWSHLFRKGAGHEFYWVASKDKPQGYVSLTWAEGRWTLQDWAVEESLLPETIAAIFQAARTAGATRVGGWMPDTSPFRENFQLEPRTRELTMIKFLNQKRKVDRRLQEAAGGFRAIDHV